jgi:hypothetical protein
MITALPWALLMASLVLHGMANVAGVACPGGSARIDSIVARALSGVCAAVEIIVCFVVTSVMRLSAGEFSGSRTKH